MSKKILILSDSHQQLDIREITDNESFDFAIHAGDSQLQATDKEMEAFDFKARGNCDWDRQYDDLVLNYIKDIGNIAVTHGHLIPVDVKIDLESIYDLVDEESLNLIVYGHNHILNIEYLPRKDALIINPGSAGISKSKYPETYLILEYTKREYNIEVKNAHTLTTIEKHSIKRNNNEKY